MNENHTLRDFRLLSAIVSFDEDRNKHCTKGISKILKINDKKFAENLVKWADVIRKTFYDGGIDEIISTRRIVHIANAYAIFKNKMKAIQVCTNRFDEDTKNSLP